MLAVCADNPTQIGKVAKMQRKLKSQPRLSPLTKSACRQEKIRMLNQNGNICVGEPQNLEPSCFLDSLSHRSGLLSSTLLIAVFTCLEILQRIYLGHLHCKMILVLLKTHPRYLFLTPVLITRIRSQHTLSGEIQSFL